MHIKDRGSNGGITTAGRRGGTQGVTMTCRLLSSVGDIPYVFACFLFSFFNTKARRRGPSLLWSPTLPCLLPRLNARRRGPSLHLPPASPPLPSLRRPLNAHFTEYNTYALSCPLVWPKRKHVQHIATPSPHLVLIQRRCVQL
jgi:hypothetical protein